MTLRPLGEGYVITLGDAYDYPGEWQHDDRSVQVNGESAVQVSCVTDTGDLALRIEFHDQASGPDDSRAWQFGPEDALLQAASENLLLVIPCQGDLSEQPTEPPLALPTASPGKPCRFHIRLYGRADSTEFGVGARGEHHLIQLWPAE
ncbi:hypothetical protein DN069_34810 [Streptacidiphilus pinicola]|uniref:Uncharacterized protein n=1 Tax=Streptacidiphilus pinicola TaxID=2219663 RepID=A0A2X0IBS7_9ACTN|nr:hypothetical protein [Streptacidiphilus pinicola]RAG81053.1 hypothetical protein DN069_34810 [Streptacidiphilus pinicola]